METSILYEPLPVGRIGVRREDQEVVVATDFSTIAFMLEEFVSLAVTNIAMPRSAPETEAVARMPAPLRSRVRIIDDHAERAAVDRLLEPVRTELAATLENNRLRFPKATPIHTRSAVIRLHDDLYRLALGFNHNLQVSVTPTVTAKTAREVRKLLRDTHARGITAQVEGLLRAYEPLRFEMLSPTTNVPSELISIFDRLINDSRYLEASDAVSKLALPRERRAALARLRSYVRSVIGSSRLGAFWNAAAKLVSVWSGAPVPETEQLTTIIVPRTFPMLVNLTSARQRAVEMWLAAGTATAPCNRHSVPYAEGEVYWLPPMKSVKASEPGDSALMLGNVGDLREALKQIPDDLKISVQKSVRRAPRKR